MPYMKLSGLSKERVCEASKDLVEIVSKATDTPKERIRIFYNPTLEIVNGEICENRLNIDVSWMPRPQEMCDEVAKKIKEYFIKDNFESIKVYFSEIVKDRFYI